MQIFKMDEYGDVLSPKDIKDILGVGWNKTYDLLKSGAIQSFKIGRDIRIPKECLKDYIGRMIAEARRRDT